MMRQAAFGRRMVDEVWFLKLTSIPSKLEWDLTNGPCSVSCDRAIRYSGLLFGVRGEFGVRSLENYWISLSVFQGSNI